MKLIVAIVKLIVAIVKLVVVVKLKVVGANAAIAPNEVITSKLCFSNNTMFQLLLYYCNIVSLL